MFSIAIPDQYRESFFARYFPVFHILFVVGFFFLSTRWHRNFYYLLIVVPFLIVARWDSLRALFKSRVLLLALLYCLYMLLSLGWAADLGSGQMLDFVRKALLVSAFLMSTVYLFAGDWNKFPLLTRYVSWTAGLTAVASIVWFGNTHAEFRIIGIGTLNSSITAGSGYAAAALMGYGGFLLAGTLSARKTLLTLLPIFAAITLVVLTKSRGPLLALAAVMTLSTILARPRRLPVVLGCFGLSFALALTFHLFEFADLMDRGSSYRLTIWRQSIARIREHPWFGYGLGGGRPEIVYELGSLAHSHNLFLSNTVDGGACALLLLVSLLIMAIYWAIRFFRDEGNVTLLSLVAFSVAANLTDGKTLIVSPNYQWLYFWLPVALAAAYELRCKRASNTDFLKDKKLQTGIPERVDSC
jgi:O-antigen ligase